MSDNGQENVQPIQPVPVPWSYDWGKGQAPDGSQICVLRLLLPTGQVVLFMPPEFASQFGKSAIQQSTGLVIPPASTRFTPPKGHG